MHLQGPIKINPEQVICAFGRLGTMLGCDKYGIKPNLVCIAKALSSGYLPIAAVIELIRTCIGVNSTFKYFCIILELYL
ncbi:hypothetical protein MKW98_023008 [Papaver atlanticum]|uniref:Uncharacterized protein n=1 Tax=Papaver atlanticum TaxID=357466 RepID=A0AAD4TA23_9MAGN|nr:hypothetical protein MKW98_023008 [Papaver atlanticum]